MKMPLLCACVCMCVCVPLYPRLLTRHILFPDPTPIASRPLHAPFQSPALFESCPDLRNFGDHPYLSPRSFCKNIGSQIRQLHMLPARPAPPPPRALRRMEYRQDTQEAAAAEPGAPLPPSDSWSDPTTRQMRRQSACCPPTLRQVSLAHSPTPCLSTGALSYALAAQAEVRPCKPLHCFFPLACQLCVHAERLQRAMPADRHLLLQATAQLGTAERHVPHDIAPRPHSTNPGRSSMRALRAYLHPQATWHPRHVLLRSSNCYWHQRQRSSRNPARLSCPAPPANAAPR